MKQRQDELADLGGQIDYQVRTAFLDIRTASDQVAVAQSNLDLANQTLEQARDRFSAGVTDNIEVVQAQESVAAANDSLIAALYGHNLAKVALARALGATDQEISTFDGGEVSMAEPVTKRNQKRPAQTRKARAGSRCCWRSSLFWRSPDSFCGDISTPTKPRTMRRWMGTSTPSAPASAATSSDVLAEDEQYVKAGDVLVRIDPKDYEVALAKAEADLADAEAALETSRIDIPITSINTSSQLKTANSGRADATAFLLGAERQLNAAQARLVSAQRRGARGRSEPDQSQ